MSKLTKRNYIKQHRCKDDTNITKDLFFAHPIEVDLLCAFPCVLLIDYTHTTNIYHHLLLEIVGITPTEYTYAIIFVFLEFEQEDNYIWALNRLNIMMSVDSLPEVIMTKRELALMNDIKKCLSCYNKSSMSVAYF